MIDHEFGEPAQPIDFWPRSMNPLPISVVICFRDWPVEHLRRSITSMLASQSPPAEIVLSDYGSSDPERSLQFIRFETVRRVYTANPGPWSRSRALNVGVHAATSDFIVTTDADILFAPATIGAAYRELLKNPDALYLIQCRDLPEDLPRHHLDQLEWDRIESAARLRPRSGMGGFAAFARSRYLAVGGYDERMIVYGSEDIDFAKRMRSNGAPLVWIDSSARIYHQWHPNTGHRHRANAQEQKAIQRNRALRQGDTSLIRNPRGFGNLARPPQPRVSVLVAARGQPQALADTLSSIQIQSLQEFEVVVVDDGSAEAATRETVAALEDSRFRHMVVGDCGLGRARNLGVQVAQAPYVVLQDEGDIMLPTRLEAHVSSMAEGLLGTYGGWIDFDAASGALQYFQGRQFSLASVLFSSRVLAHGATMFRTSALRAFPYREDMESGPDFNLVLRLAAAGGAMRHTGEFAILRRAQSDGMTQDDAYRQRLIARMSTGPLMAAIPAPEAASMRNEAKAAKTLACKNTGNNAAFISYLPDQLVRREIIYPDRATESGAAARTDLLYGPEGVPNPSQGSVRISDAKWTDMRTITRGGVARFLEDVEIRATRRNGSANGTEGSKLEASPTAEQVAATLAPYAPSAEAPEAIDPPAGPGSPIDTPSGLAGTLVARWAASLKSTAHAPGTVLALHSITVGPSAESGTAQNDRYLLRHGNLEIFFHTRRFASISQFLDSVLRRPPRRPYLTVLLHRD